MSLKIALAISVSLFLCSGIYAQKRSINENKEPSKSARNIQNHSRELEVVFYPTVDDMCSDEVTSFGLEGSWGFISGNNEFGDKEKAQLLEFTGSATFQILGVGGFFVMPSIVGGGMISAKVYMMDEATGGPGELSSTSMPLNISEIIPPSDSAVELTIFDFGEDEIPFVDYASFFAAFDFSALYASQDTVGLYHTMEECGSGSNSWEKWADDTWHSLDSAYNPALNIDFLITAIVQFDEMTTVDEYINDRGLQLYPASPNPAQEKTILNYALEQADQVDIQIFDAQGKLIKALTQDLMPAGRHQKEVFTYDYSPGTYFYRIATNNGHLMSRFVVQH
jgi:hypothetical protein